jgi:NAD(P)-dependent dehydrogenase (short-subunit alcohol dehydrogenase family)
LRFDDIIICQLSLLERTSQRETCPTLHPMATSQPQSILLVGGGQGIGYETVKSILSLSRTARIVVFDLRFDPNIPYLMRQHAKRLLIVQGDVRIADDRKRAVALCESESGGVDTLVYTAGVIAPIERIENLGIEDVRDAFEVNVFGCMAVVRIYFTLRLIARCLCADADDMQVPTLPSSSASFAHDKLDEYCIRENRHPELDLRQIRDLPGLDALLHHESRIDSIY